jgi:membrane-bound lytic murein transglycosylase D
LIESGLMNDISPKDAVGFWQILKSAGKENGLEITKEVDERYDPLKATEAACKYLKKAYAKFGNWTEVAASYNRGMGGMERALENQNVESYYDLFLNDETARYVFRILACKEIIENPARYGFKVSPRHLYEPEKLQYVEVRETIPDLIAFAKKNNTNYKLLKRHNPWLRDEKLTVKKGKSIPNCDSGLVLYLYRQRTVYSKRNHIEQHIRKSKLHRNFIIFCLLTQENTQTSISTVRNHIPAVLR